MWKHGTYLADAGGSISTGARGGVWRSALGTIGIYIPFKRISLGTAGNFFREGGEVSRELVPAFFMVFLNFFLLGLYIPYPTTSGRFLKNGSGNFSAPVSYDTIDVKYNGGDSAARGIYDGPT